MSSVSELKKFSGEEVASVLAQSGGDVTVDRVEQVLARLATFGVPGDADAMTVHVAIDAAVKRMSERASGDARADAAQQGPLTYVELWATGAMGKGIVGTAMLDPVVGSLSDVLPVGKAFPGEIEKATELRLPSSGEVAAIQYEAGGYRAVDPSLFVQLLETHTQQEGAQAQRLRKPFGLLDVRDRYPRFESEQGARLFVQAAHREGDNSAFVTTRSSVMMTSDNTPVAVNVRPETVEKLTRLSRDGEPIVAYVSIGERPWPFFVRKVEGLAVFATQDHQQSYPMQGDAATGDHLAALRALYGDAAVTQAVPHVDAFAHLRPAEQRIVAVFQPQALVDDQPVDIDGVEDVDVTGVVLSLPLAQLHALEDYRDSADALVTDSSAVVEHDGPFTVRVTDSICTYFAVDRLADITQAQLAAARVQAFLVDPAAPGRGAAEDAMEKVAMPYRAPLIPLQKDVNAARALVPKPWPFGHSMTKPVEPAGQASTDARRARAMAWATSVMEIVAECKADPLLMHLCRPDLLKIRTMLEQSASTENVAGRIAHAVLKDNDDEVLDEVVLRECAALANGINEEGAVAQVNYLLSNGWSETMILAAAGVKPAADEPSPGP